jgi:hypothetical protein
LGRTVVRRADVPRRRNSRDWLLLVLSAVVVIFALIGVVSAGAWVGGKLSSSKPSRHHANSGPSSLTSADITRAHAQATAIIRAAQSAGQVIVKQQTRRAHTQAAHILANARKSSSRVASSKPASTPVSSSAGTTSGSVATPTSAAGAAGGSFATPGAAVGATTATGSSVTGTAPVSTPGAVDLSGVPASWLVVGYNATFGNGPGTAGSITVTNRGSKSFSGVATVHYVGASGTIGSASAPFSGLAPGETEVLPLNGESYPAGASTYTISVSVG